MAQFQIQLWHSFLTQGWQSSWGPGTVCIIEKCSMVHSQFPSPWNLTKVSIFSFLGSWPGLSVQSATSCLFWCPNESLFWDPPSSLKYLPGPRTAAYYPINPRTFLSLLALEGILKSSLSSGSFNIESLLNAKHLLLLSSRRLKLNTLPSEAQLLAKQKPGDSLSSEGSRKLLEWGNRGLGGLQKMSTV